MYRNVVIVFIACGKSLSEKLQKVSFIEHLIYKFLGKISPILPLPPGLMSIVQSRIKLISPRVWRLLLCRN